MMNEPAQGWDRVKSRAVTPLLLPLLTYWGIVAAMVGASLWLTGGSLAYPRDDTYIHMAVARSLAEHGIWGVTRHAFASAASSISWPLLLALVDRLFGVADVWPLLLNMAAGSAIVIVLVRETAPYLADRPRRQTLAVAGIMLLIPLPALTLVAMEHLLHVLLALLFVTMAARCVAGDRPVSPLLLMVTFILMATRYESAVLIVPTAFLFLLRRRWASALLVATAGALPVLLFGIYARSWGGLFLPNSILVNANQPEGEGWLNIYIFLRGWFFRPASAFPLLVMLLLNLWVVAQQRTFSALTHTVPRVMSVLFIAGTLGHVTFSDVAQLAAQESGYTAQRYDAYLLTVGLLATVANWHVPLRQWQPRRYDLPKSVAIGLAIFVLLPPLYERAGESAVRTPLATKNIFEQQVQMGHFLEKFYEGETVVANDIGAITYYPDIDLIDYIGLGSDDVARLKLADNLDPSTLDPIIRDRDASIAIVYDDWLRNSLGTIPNDWTLVGRWAIQNNVIAARSIVSFYAITPGEVESLRANLEAYHPLLPADVVYGINPRLDKSDGS